MSTSPLPRPTRWPTGPFLLPPLLQTGREVRCPSAQQRISANSTTSSNAVTAAAGGRLPLSEAASLCADAQWLLLIRRPAMRHGQQQSRRRLFLTTERTSANTHQHLNGGIVTLRPFHGPSSWASSSPKQAPGITAQNQ